MPPYGCATYMAGSPTFGKMSTGMRSAASVANNAMATNATTMVMGRLSAAKTKRMFPSSSESLARLHDKRLNVARRGGDCEQGAPDGETGQSVVDLGLSEQTLGFGDFVDVG